MQLGELLLPILGGYLFLNVFYQTRYTVVRDTGYHLFFKAAITGSILFGSAFLLVNSVWPLLPEIITDLLGTGRHLTTIIVSALLGGISPFILNIFCDDKKAARKAALNRGDRLELIMARSFEEPVQLEISLNSNKCYIGYVVESPVQTPYAIHDAACTTILPTASGYREPKTRELILTTWYSDFLASNLDDQNLDDFTIVIPVSEILSARVFNFEIYEKYFKPGQG